ncbi:MAG: flippase [Calditrichota bacterium]
MFKSLFKTLEHRRLFANVQNLFLVQATNYLLPLLVIPYIVRVIGPDKFGLISFAQTTILYFLMITDYGFDITGTQWLAQNQDDGTKRSELFSTVTSLKAILCFFCAILLLIATTLFPAVREHATLYWAYFLMIPGMLMFSNWYYMGMEEMKYLNYPNVISKIGYAAGVFLFVKVEADYEKVALFYGLSIFIGGLFSLWILKRRFNISFTLQPINKLITAAREGWAIFLSTFAIHLYRRSNIFFLGLVAPSEAVGYYSAGEKIVKALQSTFVPVTQAFYPFISRRMNVSKGKTAPVIKKLMLILGASTFLLSLLMSIFAEPLITFFAGERFVASILVFQIACFVICFGVLNYILGILFMTNIGLKHEFTMSVIIIALINVALCLILSNIWQEIGAAMAFVTAEALLLLLLISFSLKNKHRWSDA